MHLADSAFPIGASSHSFGLETLAAEGSLRAIDLEALLTDLLWENSYIDAIFVGLAYQLAKNPAVTATNGTSETNGEIDKETVAQWQSLNRFIAATKVAHESRMASATLGRRFLQSVATLEDAPLLQMLYHESIRSDAEIHYNAAFGFAGGYLALGLESTMLAYVQQNLMGLLSASLRLLAIGQARTGEILWRLKPIIDEVVQAGLQTIRRYPNEGDQHQQMRSEWSFYFEEISFFAPQLELGSMRHPSLRTRLFIS